MKVKLRKIINLNEDSVLIYSMEKKWVDREVIGVERSEVSRII
ncbi:CRISPR-associated endonuclease Cas2 [Candidatus Kryptonium thompsonii]|nr:CRISPR-associated endonuclease Cas2 [Candidatus Kryptonium thompsoni]